MLVLFCLKISRQHIYIYTCMLEHLYEHISKYSMLLSIVDALIYSVRSFVRYSRIKFKALFSGSTDSDSHSFPPAFAHIISLCLSVPFSCFDLLFTLRSLFQYVSPVFFLFSERARICVCIAISPSSAKRAQTCTLKIVCCTLLCT